MDAVELLERDHRDLISLLNRWERAGRWAPRRRQQLMDQIMRETAAHISVQERVVYPVLLDTGEAEGLVERGLRDHRLAERALSTIQRTDPWGGELESANRAVVRFLRHHLQQDDATVVTLLARRTARERRHQVGHDVERARRTAPTRPHPRVPRWMGMRGVVDPVVRVIDRIRDGLRGVRRSLLRGRRWLLGGLDL